ncbi:MAG: hypothetical protein ACYSTL_00445 [Planctomycetota bacterium]|jgi:hypothetical protein
MTNEKIDDEMKLIDFIRGELSTQEQQQVRERLARDESFRRLHDDITNTFAAMELCSVAEAPEHLPARTMDRIAQVRRTKALLAKEEARRKVHFPTFSLREFAVTAAAIVLLVAVFVPSMSQARREAVIRNCASHAGQIGTALLTYANANDDYLPAVDTRHKRWVADQSESSPSNSAALFKLVRSGYASPIVFQCPVGKTNSFVAKAHMTDFPAGEFIGYSYQHTLGGHPMRLSDPILKNVADRMAILSDSTPLFGGACIRAEQADTLASRNHGGAGQNVLYLDMHVEWAERPTVGVQQDNIFLVDGILEYHGIEEPTTPTDTFLLPAFSACGTSGR